MGFLRDLVLQGIRDSRALNRPPPRPPRDITHVAPPPQLRIRPKEFRSSQVVPTRTWWQEVIAGLRPERPDVRAVRAREAEVRRVVGSVDPIRIVTLDQIPAHAHHRFKSLVTLANFAPATELGEALTQLYVEANQMRSGQWRDPLREVLEPPPSPRPAGIEPLAESVKLTLNVAGFQRNQWNKARAGHDAIRLEWTELLVDPWAKLENSMLLDVAEPTTGAFVTAYARVEDFCSIHGEEFDADRVEEYVALVGETAAAWTAAKTAAEEAGISYLTEEEQVHARQAIRQMAQAEDPKVPVRRRVRATKQAARLLAKVQSVEVPADLLG